MNRSDAFTAERKRIEEQLGYYVPLEDAANMMKTAQKVVSVVNSYSYSVSYQETRLILRLADKALQEITGGLE